jgi:hypothetical protein
MTVLFDAKNSAFQLNDGSSLRDISPYITSVEGLPGAAELLDVTAFGATGRAWAKGMENVTFVVEGWWSDDASVGPDTVLRLVRALTAATAFDYGPEGKTQGKQKISGTCWLRNYSTSSPIGNYVRFRAEFQVEGVITLGTYA